MWKFIKSIFRARHSTETVPDPDSADRQQTVLAAVAPLPAPRPPILAASESATLAGSASDSPSIEIPFKAVVDRLPAQLLPYCNTNKGGASVFSFSKKDLLDQLPRGAVKVTFGELRAAARPNCLTNGRHLDHLTVDLPLPEIVARLGASLAARRGQQRKLHAPEGLVGDFSIGGGRTERTPPASPPQSDPQSKSVPAPERPAVQASIPLPADFVAPQVPAPQPSPMVTPAEAPEPLPVPSPALIPFSFPTGSEAVTRTQVPPPASVAQPVVTPVIHPTEVSLPVLPDPDPDQIQVPLSTITRNWPATLVETISELQEANRSLKLPIKQVEDKLKRGKITFTWNVVRGWIYPPLSAKHATLDETELDLPLSVIAPLFLSSVRLNQRRKLVVADNIPDLFKGAAAPEPAATAPPVEAPSAEEQDKTSDKEPGHSSSELAAVTSSPGPGQATTAEVQTAQPVSSVDAPAERWTPTGLVQHVCQLAGVAGALLATHDGFLVAGELAPGLDPETSAALVPNVYQRISECAQFLGVGASAELTLTMGSTSVQIFRTGLVYLAVVGQPNRTLPIQQLMEVVARLNPAEPSQQL